MARAQTTLDFLVGTTVFLLTVSAALVTVPGLIDPFATGMEAHSITADRIAANEEYKERILRGKALAGPEKGGQVTFNPEPVTIDGTQYYVGRLDGEMLGAAFTTVTNKGYAGPIEIVIGMKGDTVTGIGIKSSSETPGLGANATAVKYGETEAWFLAQFKNLEPEQITLKKDDPEGEIDAITAATITSRAIAEAVHEEAREFQEVWPQLKEHSDYASAK